MTANNRQRQSTSRRHVRGVSLIELMVAMLIGLLVVVGAVAMFMTNRKTYTATESVGRIQESARMAFELMARDIREADGSPCAQIGPATPSQAPMLPLANVVTGATWWSSWANGLIGYDGAGLTNQLAGTDAIQVHSAAGRAISVASFAAPTFTLSKPATDFAAGDVVLACDGAQAAMFRIAAPAGSTLTVSSGADNCGQALGLGPTCGATTYAFATAGRPAMVAKLNAVQWWVQANGRGGNSLYRRINDQAASEILEGVSTPANGAGGMQLTFLQDTSTAYVPASGAVDWKRVKAVRVDLEFEGQQGNDQDAIKAGINGQGLRRTITHIVSLRNRTL